MQTYNKLVRDKIIDLIKSKGQEVHFHMASEEEYKEKLWEKLDEELQEFIEAKNKDELADILEVLDAISELYGWDKEEIRNLQESKKENRGGFKERIILESS